MNSETARQGTILIVDDEPTNVRLLECMLAQAGYKCVHSTTDPRDASRMAESLEADLLLLDLHMPCLNGFDVLRELKTSQVQPSVLVLTANTCEEAKHRALREGANDFLTKPFNQTEVLLRVRNLLNAQLDRTILDQIVVERTRELEKSQLETTQRLARAAEYRDDESGRHPERVADTAALIARALGEAEGYIDVLRQAAPLHDVGKIGVAEAILHKRGRLTPLEFESMKQHTLIGMSIMSGSSSPILQMAAKIAEYHHEYWNGDGYWGWSGEEIPLCARIVAVADAFDSMTHDKPYRETATATEAMETIRRCAGSQFDPAVVDAFLRLDHWILNDAHSVPERLGSLVMV